MSAKRRLVDTNLIVRYLVQDHEKHAKAAGKLFEACDRGDIEIVLLPAVLVFMLLLINKSRLMGKYVNGRTFNIIAWITAVILIALTVIYVFVS